MTRVSRMLYRRGNMWSVYQESDLFLITTNSYVRKDGELVMGRGIALEAKRRYPKLAKSAGDWLTKNGLVNDFYGIMVDIMDGPLGLFQVKYHFADQADLSIISNSCQMLADWISETQLEKVNINYPGIGAGRLMKSQVSPILEQHLKDLPVTVWEY